MRLAYYQTNLLRCIIAPLHSMGEEINEGTDRHLLTLFFDRIATILLLLAIL